MSSKSHCAVDDLNHYLESRYEVEREIGRGGSAIVYLARDIVHGRSVALKVLSRDIAAQYGVERFREEIEITACLQHPHILPLLDSGEAGGTLFLVTPFVDGGSLRNRLDTYGALPIDDVTRIGTSIADALAHAHRSDVVHLDLKPENVLLWHGHAMLTDFGIARVLCEACPPEGEAESMLFGTPDYMSPEQAAGVSVDARSDVYSFGYLLREMLTGRRAFSGYSPEVILGHHWHTQVAPVRGERRDVPLWLDQLITRSLEKDPAVRPQDASEVLDTFQRQAVRSATSAPGWARSRQTDLFGPVFQ